MENSGSHPEAIVPPVEGVAGGGTSYGWGDIGFSASVPMRGTIDPTKVPSEELIHVWCMPNTANVGAQEVPRQLEQLEMREKVCKLLYDQRYHGAVLVPLVLYKYRVVISDRLLVTGQSLFVRRVMPILGVPDALVSLDLPLSQISLLPGETTAVWISIDVPIAQLPGVYEGELLITAVKADAENCLDIIEPVEQKPAEEVVQSVRSATSNLRQALLSPFFSEFLSDNGPVDLMDEDEDAISNRSVHVKLNVTVWDFTLPLTPSLPAVFDYVRREVGILRTKDHWKKAYFYLWDEPLNLEHFDSIRSMANEIYSYAPDARVLTTYYCGPSDAPLAPTSFEAFLKVPKYLRPHTQIYCTSEWVLGNREDLAKDIVAELEPENGEEWWTYVCMGPPDPHPNWHLGMRGTQHRAVMWRVWKEGGTGFLYWGANCYEKASVPSAEIRFRRGLPPGDGVLYYPGEVFSSSHEPVASIRLERLLSGMQDYEYLKLYASRYGREEGLALLERTGVYMGPERYTLEHLPVDVMRGEIYAKCRTEKHTVQRVKRQETGQQSSGRLRRVFDNK
ncbi:hypothetical protein AKJ16_DCAP14999 [Drosera capensis]